MLSNPFIPILEPYFDHFSSWFGNLANECVKHNVQPEDIARDFLSKKERRDNFNKYYVPEISGYSISFWQKNLSNVTGEINALPGMKARFGGDIGPQNRDRLYQRLGVYFDSIIVPDPILRSVTLPGPNKWRDYYILKFAINLVLHRDAYLSDVYPPIAVLVGEKHLLHPSNHYAILATESEIDATLLANELFGRSFDDFQEVTSFVSKFQTDGDLVGEIEDESILLLDDTVDRGTMEQLAESDRETRIHFDERDLPGEMRGPVRVLTLIQSRMMQVNGVLQESIQLGAHPVIQAPVSFHWLTAKLKANAAITSEVMDHDLLKQLPLTNGILGKNLRWMANVPCDGLIRLREHGFLDEIRATLSKNVEALSTASLQNLDQVTNQVDYNLNTALNDHQEQLQRLHDEALDTLAAKLPSLLVSVSGAILPLFGIVPSWVALLGGTVGGLTLKDILPKIVDLKRQRRDLERTPMGILWNARDYGFFDED